MLLERADGAQLDAGRTPAGRTLEALYFIRPTDAKMTDRYCYVFLEKVGRGEGRGFAPPSVRPEAAGEL